MPGKHVRFAGADVFYSSPPTMPSSFSPLSSPTSSFGSPYTQLSPSLHSALGPVRINPVLGFAPRPTFAWDIARHPTSSLTPLPAHVLAEPATNPPLPSLTIISHHLPWSIVVKPSSQPHKPIPYTTTPAAPFVTVADVLSTLHRALRLAVLPAEYDQLPSHDAKYRVNRAYHARTKGSAEEARKGVKRVDFLAGHNSFLGLSSTPRGPDVWMLNVT